MISKGAITRRANDEQLPAHTIERDYVLAQLCADVGAICDARLVLKGGTLLRLCHFPEYRYSADLDFSAVDGLSTAEALHAVELAVAACRQRLEVPLLELPAADGVTAWIRYVGPLGSRPRTIKLDISDSELVETHSRLVLRPRWPDLPADPAIEGYTLDEVAAEKLRCIAERLQCRDLYDLHALLNGGHADALEAWLLYLRKAADDAARGRHRTPPREWASTFERRMASYRERWIDELAQYLTQDVPTFADIERRIRRHLAPVLAASRAVRG